ncbi:S1 family peptidase [Paenibacillus sp. KQZ6P-2]|uniref:S1 family peptidase n=1 Tax=Paenibacillus mangrovi TaxID=2931978 RepID=A0A9X2B538_9BACL|nr:S1 family peptidase [Paenibacillus mangrovi]MCJ8015314.1 S1 family peptidase [Paenibacillus mangrovi]
MKKSLPQATLLDAKFSESELNKIHEQIFSNKEKLNQISIDIKYIATDIKNNKVGIGLYDANENNQNYLKNLYGDSLVFYEANDSQFITEGDTVTATYPIQGGPQLLNSTANLVCSTGFSAKKGTTYYVVTAGYCLAGTYFQPNTTASGRYSPGIAEGANVIENGFVDALLITSSSLVVSNKVYYQYVGAKSLTS